MRATNTVMFTELTYLLITDTTPEVVLMEPRDMLLLVANEGESPLWSFPNGRKTHIDNVRWLNARKS